MTANSNVYIRPDAAESFERAAYIPPSAFDRMADALIDACHLSADTRYRVLDVGSGTGRTILGILSRFDARSIAYEAVCFDSSPAMLALFEASQRARPPLAGPVSLVCHDAATGLPPTLFPGQFDLITIVSVLHYLSDWRAFLSAVRDRTAPGGHLMLAELTGWYALLDGTVHAPGPDALSRRFWSTYFAERQRYSPWPPEVHFSNVAAATRYCQTQLGLPAVAAPEISWTSQVNWLEVLDWLAIGPASSTGSGLSRDARQALRDTMMAFLQQAHAELTTPVSITWGFRLHTHRRPV